MENSFRDNANNHPNTINNPNNTPPSDINVTNPLSKPLNQFAEKAEEYKDQATAEVKEVVDTLQEKKDQVVDQFQKVRRHATLYARENPWPLIGAAAVAGVVLGLIFGHCSHEKNCPKRWD